MGLSQLGLTGSGVAENTAVAFKSLVLASPAANTAFLAATGYSLTSGNGSMVDLAGTWNNAGSTPTAIKLNVTDTASNAASLLMDLQVGGVSQCKIDKAGKITLFHDGAGINRSISSGSGATGAIVMFPSGNFGGGNFSVERTDSTRLFSSDAFATAFPSVWLGDAALNAANVFLSSAAAATLQLGVNHATTATNQTIKAHDVTTGDAADLILKGGISGGGGSNGSVRIGTHSAIGAETVTGYITIKDEGGTVRKLAVVS